MTLKVLVLFGFVAAVLARYDASHKKEKPQPYQFGYKTRSEHGTQFRNEKSDGKGRVHGSYGYIDAAGTYREVNYVADHNGFRAEIRTNEHGISDQDPADIAIKSSALKVFNDVQNLVVKRPSVSSTSYSSKEKKMVRPKYGKYSDVRFFHFGQHSHEEKRESEDEESLRDDEEDDSDDEESKTNEDDDDDVESGMDQRSMFHRIGRHGGHA